MENKISSFVVCLVALFTVTAVTVVPHKPAPNKRPAGETPLVAEGPHIEGDVAKLSGEAFFRGLYFGRGEAAAIFMDLSFMRAVYRQMQQTNRRLMKASNPIGLQVIEQIKQSHPSFFARFGQALHSGDHIVIKHALQKANKLLARNIKVAGAARQGVRGANVVIVPSPAVVIYVPNPCRIVVPCLPVTIVDVKNSHLYELPKHMTQLQKEQLVNTIATFAQTTS